MLYKISQRLIYLNHLISKKCTGTPKELADKLGLSERGWYKLRDELVNDLDLPIAYDHYRKTYFYTKEGKFEFGFKPLSVASKEAIKGGASPSIQFTSSFVR